MVLVGVGVSVTGACSGPPAPPDVLLVTLDTTRADALGIYGASPSPSPVVDALAADGAVVDEAMAVYPVTLPAHASIMTGLYPDRHGVRGNDGYQLDEAHQTLAEHLGAAGWATGAFVASRVLDRALGVGQGFSVYGDRWPRDQAAVTDGQRDGDAVADEASRWILDQVRRDPARPILVWMHLYDAHHPLQPLPELAAKYTDPYAAEISRADRAVGRVLEHLRALGRDRVYVVVVGDHGESRGDHGEETHGLFVYRSTMRVPLVVAGPDVRPGRRLSGPLSQVDLLPTVLDLVGQAVPPDLDGRSFAGALRGGDDVGWAVHGESWVPRLSYGLSELTVVQDGQHRHVTAPRSELYDWRADPGERSPIDDPTGAGLVAIRDAHAARPGAGPPSPSALSPALDEQLAALGYVEGSPLVPLSVPGAELPDPKDHVQVQALVAALQLQARTRPPEVVARSAEALLKAYPNVAAAWEALAAARERRGEHALALEAMAPLISARPDDPRLVAWREKIRLADGQPGAAEALAALVEQHPDLMSARVAWATHLRSTGDCRAAAAQADEGLVHDPYSTPLRLVRGACRSELGQDGAAVGDLSRVLQEDPESPDAAYFLGRSLARMGHLDQALPLARLQVERTPDEPRALALLGLILYTAGDSEQAEPILERVVAQDVIVGPEPLGALADLRGRAGHYDEAMALLDRAEQLSPGSQALTRVRATVLMDQGRVQEAQALLGASAEAAAAPGADPPGP
jgi:arylsulfatase A-like enzyme/tetratricopeptide (TPR) repeat protein